jgi:hypothetical protein
MISLTSSRWLVYSKAQPNLSIKGMEARVNYQDWVADKYSSATASANNSNVSI